MGIKEMQDKAGRKEWCPHVPGYLAILCAYSLNAMENYRCALRREALIQRMNWETARMETNYKDVARVQLR